MLEGLGQPGGALLAAIDLQVWQANIIAFLQVLIGFSIIIFVHELGHFLFAKWCGVRVDRFSIGFGPRLFGYRAGEGFTWGAGANFSAEEMQERGWSETDYCFRALPLGGYVKMLGQDDILIDEQTGAVTMTDDPRAFTNRPVSHRMVIVSAGVIFNLLFAAFLFMWVFLIGLEMPAPIIGQVVPMSSAEAAGLQAGDRVTAINGRRVDSYLDVEQAEILYDDLRLKVERNGEPLADDIIVHTQVDAETGMRSAGLMSAVTTKVLVDALPLAGRETLKAGDIITQVSGQPVARHTDIQRLFRESNGDILELTVERPEDPEKRDSPTKTVTCYHRPALAIAVADESKATPTNYYDYTHILGFQPRQQISVVGSRYPAKKAGFQVGDVITEWGTVTNPLYSEIISSITANDGHEVCALVDRLGVDEPAKLCVTPRSKFRMFRSSRPQVGLGFRCDGRQAVVADTMRDTPAAELHLPRGAELISIAGRPVRDWYDVVKVLRSLAGERVEVCYRAGGREGTGQMSIPSSVVNEAKLPDDALVWSIEILTPDGEEADADNTPARAESTRARPLLPFKLKRRLEELVGETIVLTYTRYNEPGQQFRSEPFVVREDNTDPWQMRMMFRFDMFDQANERLMERINAHGNPLRATWMGVKLTYYQVLMVYRTIKQLLRAKVSVDAVSGPIGIFDIAISHAKRGFAELLFFLALLSLNLAVLNFLPLPVVDGGVMVFLIIEKIKGKPLSLKTQMISTLVGLSLLLIVFVLVTFQDLMKIIFG